MLRNTLGEFEAKHLLRNIPGELETQHVKEYPGGKQKPSTYPWGIRNLTRMLRNTRSGELETQQMLKNIRGGIRNPAHVQEYPEGN